MGAMKAWYMEAVELIRQYVMDEYDCEMDDSEFDNLNEISIAYTSVYTSDDIELPLQVYVDIPNCTINYYVAGELHRADTYTDEEFLGALANLDFSAMVGSVEAEL